MKTHDLFPFTFNAQFLNYYTLDMKKENNIYGEIYTGDSIHI